MTNTPGFTQPSTLPALLRQLGLQTTSAYQHRPVLAEWFEQNTPSADLRISLRANGYGMLFLSSLRPMRSTVSALRAAA